MSNSLSWHYQSVQAYFGHFNWLGQPGSRQNGQVATPALTLATPVAEFFQMFPWEGTPVVAALPASSSTPAASTGAGIDVTLDDLLDIF